ncbi:unnamed protein product [Miscanthus lutarioriparius]|uniref:Integrase zinc-binding domain-containing protein n=1 Tax=Miscanthus lutarioriparius TaxID=422564 RepID=A0A811SIN3_9POAL|nr:unnamed protein product [Miscanthus lutarioriparius]
MQQKAFIKLLGLQYKILYKKGLENKAVDALSRQAEPSSLAAFTASTLKLLEIILEGYQQDDQTKQLLTELSITGSNDKGFTLSDGLIKYENRIWLGNHKEAQQAVLLALHSSGLGGHSGITATYQKVKSLFAWSNMKQFITDYINACEHNLARAQQRMQHQADKHRQERSFDVGDWVYVKLQPHIQQSVQCRSNQKLNYKYFGPYLILQTVLAERLNLVGRRVIPTVLVQRESCPEHWAT